MKSKDFLRKAIREIKRIGSELTILGVMVIIGLVFSSFLLDTLAGLNLLSSLASVMIRVSCGILHAHISRQLLFPYIHFSTEEDWSNNLMIVLWYPVIIMAWARGG